ncbi:MAG: Fe-S cluster assembly sulfur transfer protein SufU [Actinomycetota bacterium]
MSLDDLYREVILDHYRNPRNKRPLEGADIDLLHNNPLCGDEISVRVKLADGVVEDAAFEGQGCSISQASASMLTDKVKGMKLGDVEELILEFRGMMEGKEGPDDDALGDLVALKGVVKYPVRIKCAVLAWDTLQEGVETFKKSSEG